jgi:hypothetical protein
LLNSEQLTLSKKKSTNLRLENVGGFVQERFHNKDKNITTQISSAISAYARIRIHTIEK